MGGLNVDSLTKGQKKENEENNVSEIEEEQTGAAEIEKTTEGDELPTGLLGKRAGVPSDIETNAKKQKLELENGEGEETPVEAETPNNTEEGAQDPRED